MAFDNIPKVGARYEDGNLKDVVFSTQPRILILAPAESGLSDERFDVSNSGAAEQEFGANTELCKGMHEAFAQGADNVSLMRIGGTQGQWVATDSAGETLTITPEFRDDEILERYALFIETVDGANRIVIYDLIDEEWVFDSLDILVISDGSIDVDDTGIALFTLGDMRYPSDALSLAEIVVGDFTAVGATTMTTVVMTAGTDGTNMSLVQRYAALNRAYFNLDFQDADFVIPKSVYVDSPNVVDGATPNFFMGVPEKGTSQDALGYLWQYVFQGQLYTYFTDTQTYFSTLGSENEAARTVNTSLVLTAQKPGVGGNQISIQVNAAGAAGPTAVVSEPSAGQLHVLVTDDGTGTTAQAATAINNALDAYVMPNGQPASDLVVATGGVTLLTTVAKIFLTGGDGGGVLTHEDLTGDPVPAAVAAKFADGSDSQLRECNFAHQLATFCYFASTTWKTMQGSISASPPPGFSRNDIAAWVGSPPQVVQLGLDLAIDTPSDNGSGLLGLKLMVGKSISSNGYRSLQVEEGNSTDSYLYGGIIATNGLSLPNEAPEWAYGIDDSDEATDENGFPVDIGKHVHVTTDWVVHRNAFNGGSDYRGSIETILVAILARIPENEEPIGRDYPVRKITSVPRIHASQRDSLAKFRYVNLRREEGVGFVFNSVRTAAHKIDSDYTRSSTIRCVNRELTGIRRISKNYLGKPFSSSRLAALQADIDGFLVGERRDGFNEGAVATVSFTRSDKILGRLTIRLKMVPPFTIEQITAVMSLAADDTELS